MNDNLNPIFAEILATIAPPEREIEVEVIAGVEGPCLAVDGYRVAGPKPWGGGRVVYRFTVRAADLRAALARTSTDEVSR